MASKLAPKKYKNDSIFKSRFWLIFSTFWQILVFILSSHICLVSVSYVCWFFLCLFMSIYINWHKVCLSVYLSICLSIYPPIFIYLCFCLWLSFYQHILPKEKREELQSCWCSLSVSIYLSIYLSNYLSYLNTPHPKAC